MSNKISSKNNKTKNLELDVKEKELEYEAIKEAIEKGNMNILSNFNIKNIKSTKFSTKIPKKLSEKEKERRDEIRRLKEAEDLEQIQQKLFRQVKGRRKIEPLYNKKSLYANKDVFGSNIDKECEKILVKEEKHNKLKKNDLMKPNNIKINNNDINARRNYKIHCDKKEESDEEKDKIYLNELDKDIKDFYMEKCGNIFNFLKEIYLCRYIDDFLKRGLDIYEEFIDIEDDFFKNPKNNFLNESQQNKFYKKIHEIKNINNNKDTPNPLNKSNGKKIEVNNNNTNEDIKNKKINELNINEIIEKAKNINNINNNEKIIKDTSAKISPEELMYKTNNDIDFIEKQRTEDFKKAVENWRNNTNSRPNTSHISNPTKYTSEIGLNINQPFEKKIMSYCWNCYKKFIKDEGVSKEYFNNFELNAKYNMKNFCSDKCRKDYEKKQRNQFMCFQCKKICNIMDGFIHFEGSKFCSNVCKNKYIEEDKENTKNIKKKNKKNKNKNKEINDERNNNNNDEDIRDVNDNMNDIENKDKNEDINDEEDYDPMEDF